MLDSNLNRRRFGQALLGLLVASALPLPAFAKASSGGKLKIGIIGSGHIGGAVGGLWIKAGHPVFFSSRHPEELKDLVQGLGSLAQAGSVQDAIAFADVVFIAVPYGAVPQIGHDNASGLKGKIVLDACNAVPARDGDVANEVEANGIGVTSQKYFAGTHLVRAFNTMNYMILEREAHRAPPLMAIPIAGDDKRAVKIASRLVKDAGFEPVVVGDLKAARLFQRGGPGYGQSTTAPELRKILNLKS